MKRKYQIRPFLFDQDDDDPCFSVQGAWQGSTITPQEIEPDKIMSPGIARLTESGIICLTVWKYGNFDKK